MQVQPRFLMYFAVKQGKFCKQRQQSSLELSGFRRPGGSKGLGQLALVGGHHRRAAALHGAPAVGLHGVDQLVLGHPLLPRKLVLDAEEIIGVGQTQLGQHRAAGQLQPVGGVFQIQPGQVVQLALPQVALPGGKDLPQKIVAVVPVGQPYDAVHVKIDGAVGVAGQEQRFEAVGPGRRPHLIGSPPLFGGVAPGVHQQNSFSAVSLAGMRAAMTSRISPCS